MGLRLASDLGWRFIDADDFRRPDGDAAGHGDARAAPRTASQADAAVTLHSEIAGALARGENVVLADPALTAQRRRELNDDFAEFDVRFVHLQGPAALLRRRLRNRSGHFLGDDTLANQVAILEEARDAVAIDVDERPGRIVERIRDALGL